VREHYRDERAARSAERAPELPLPDLLALQRSAGNQACVHLLQRKTTAAAGGGLLVQFTVGIEISSRLAAEALERTAAGPLTDEDIGELRETALASGRTIDDDERMFLAAMLDARNAAQLQRERAGTGFPTGTSITIPGDRISAADRERVRDFGREEDEPTAMAIGGARATPEQRIVSMAGTGFAARARSLIALAKADKVPLPRATSSSFGCCGRLPRRMR
jgi:hypothetical protein